MYIIWKLDEYKARILIEKIGLNLLVTIKIGNVITKIDLGHYRE